MFEKLKNFFKRKKKNNRVILDNPAKKSFVKKRKHLIVNLDFLKGLKILQRKYIPYFLIFAVVFVLIIVFLVVGPFFRVKYIEIIKKDDITNMDIAYKAVDYFRGKQLLSIDEVEVFNRLKNYEDNIQSVSISFSLPNTLKIEIGSFKEMFNVLINEKNYILVENGTLVPANPNKNLRLLNVKKDFDKNSFIEYKQVFQPKYIEKINNIVKRFEQNFINVPIEALHYYEVERELHLEISGNRLLIFSLDTNTSVESQIEKLAIFNKDYFTIGEGAFVYMDLRIPNKIFYCPLSSKAQCEKNLANLYN